MQSDIFKYVIQTLKKNLSTANELEFSIVDDFSNELKNEVKFVVTDIFQTTNDKTGQRIIVDELRYEVPALYQMRIRVLIHAPLLEDALSLFGYIAVFFKDNTVYECNEYNWHGNKLNKFILEPVVRRDSSENFSEGLYLDYRVEVELNSLKGESFVRVEKKDLSAKQVNR